MAMTKKEKAAYDAAIKTAETAAALRWTEPVEPDLPVPERIGEHTQGWEINAYSALSNSYNATCVYEAWSERTVHGSGDYKWDRSRGGSQGGRPLYSTKLLALKAVRHEAEKLMAERLQSIDLLIRAAQQPQPQEQDAK